MNWKLKPQHGGDATEPLERAMSTAAGPFPQALANVLLQRGIADAAAARLFLQPAEAELLNPFLLHDMDRACARILQALEDGERILVYGDYDVDGTTSVSLLYLFFRDLGFEFEVYVPDRFKEGYGISFEGVTHAQATGCRLIIALDCGTKAVEKVRFANEKGIEVIVVDHHQPGPELPATAAMINPLQPACSYPDKNLSACGLTLKLCQALLSSLPAHLSARLEEGYDPLIAYGDLVALSTACDIVPLVGENRKLVAVGMEKLRQNPLPGIAALKDLDDRNRDWTVSDMVFYLGPRINSAGRMHLATESVELLTGKGADLNAIAHSLNAFNEERKAQEKQITDEALAMIAASGQAPAATVLCEPGWNKGVIGIVASRLIEHHHRPTILLTRSGDYLVGSGRSVPGFDLHEAIEACQSHLVQFGGHKYAAGLTLKEEEFGPFKSAFEAYVEGHIAPESMVPELLIDAPVSFPAITDRFVRILRRMAPFGPGNPEPNFVAMGVEVMEAKVLKEVHVRLLLSQGGTVFEAIAFFMAERWAKVNSLRIDVVFQPDIKSWNGRSYVQLKVKDFRVAR